MPTDETTETTPDTADTVVLPLGPEPEPEPEPAANDTPQQPAAPPSEYEVRVTITPARRVVVRVDETTGVVYEEPVQS